MVRVGRVRRRIVSLLAVMSCRDHFCLRQKLPAVLAPLLRTVAKTRFSPSKFDLYSQQIHKTHYLICRLSHHQGTLGELYYSYFSLLSTAESTGYYKISRWVNQGKNKLRL